MKIRKDIMEVKAWTNGSNHYGIYVGVPNRKEYFDPDWKHIEVYIEGKLYTFRLTGKFWEGCPEFRDCGKPIIREFLTRHELINWSSGNRPKFDLVPLGGNRFRLEG